MNAHVLPVSVRQQTDASAHTFEHMAEFPLQSHAFAVLRAERP